MVIRIKHQKKDERMKKIYFAPETTIVKIATTHMIAASGPDGFNQDLAEGEGESGNGGNALSRGGFTSVWDDEDDYDD